MRKNVNKLEEKVKKILKDKKLLSFIIIAVIFFGVLINLEYATDTYAVFTAGAKEDTKHFMSCGRFVSAFATIAAKVLHLGNNTIYIVSFLMAMVSLVISLYELEKIINKDIKNNFMSSLIAILIIVNAFIIELFLFIEKGVLILSILMNILALKYFIKYFDNKKIKNLFISAAFMFIANGSYQGTVGLFIALAVIYIIKNTKSVKDFIVDNVFMGLIYVVPAILDLLIAKLFQGTRVSGSIILSETINKVINSTKSMFKTYSILPKYAFGIFFILVIMFLIYKIIKEKNSAKIKTLQILSVVYVIVANLAVTILPQLMQNTESIWMTARSTYTFASLIGILLLYLYMNFDMENEIIIKDVKCINFTNIIILFSIVYMIMEYVAFSQIEAERYKLNEMDKEISIQIVKKINEYEKETGNKITKISVYYDKFTIYTYNGIKAIKDMNIKAYSTDWSTQSIIEFYLGRKLELIEKDNEIERYFENNDWTIYNDEQVVLDNDTVHLCCY